jgi:altronate dehydratase small subunit
MNWQAVALNDRDNVAVALEAIAPAASVTVWKPGGLTSLTAGEAVPFCHKIALAPIGRGEPVFRYGQCIGEARQDIAAGAWVHVHNLASRRARG